MAVISSIHEYSRIFPVNTQESQILTDEVGTKWQLTTNRDKKVLLILVVMMSYLLILETALKSPRPPNQTFIKQLLQILRLTPTFSLFPQKNNVLLINPPDLQP